MSEPSPLRRVLITGVSGWLGQFLHRALTRAFPEAEVFGTFCGHPPLWLEEARRLRVDLADPHGVEAAISTVRPEAVVHLAAISSPGACERDEARATSVNCPSALVDAVARLVPDCLFVFTSTDLVYDGEHAPYSPDLPHADLPPVNAYGRSKLSGEMQVLRLRNAVVLRLSNIIGPSFAYEPAGTKFLEWLCRACLRREYCDLRFDELRSFVYVEDVVKTIVCLLQRGLPRSGLDAGRVLNVGGPRGLSRLDLGVLVAEVLTGSEGEGSILIDDSPNADAGNKAQDETQGPWRVFRSSNAESVRTSGIPNPRDVTMDSSATERLLGFRFTDMREAIPICVSEIRKLL